MRMPELVGCYTDATGVGGLVRLDDATSVPLESPTWLTRAHGLIWAVCEVDESRVVSLRPGPDGPTVISTTHSRGAAGCHLAASPDARWLAVAHYTSGSVALLRCAADGSLSEPVALLTFEGSSVDPDRQEAPHAHQIVWLDDATLVVPDLGSDRVRVLSVRDAQLHEAGSLVLPDGFGPRHLVWRATTDGSVHLVVAGELSGEVSSWTHAPGDWASGWREVDRTTGTRRRPPEACGSQPSGLRVLGDGLVLANRGVNTLAFLDWLPDGTLALTDEVGCGGDHPRDIAVIDDVIWVANQHSDSISVLRLTGASGGREAHEEARFAVSRPASLLF